MSGKQNILITGGAGFIGSNLCRYFVSKGHYVRCLDNFLTGKKSNIEDLLGHENFELFEADIRNFEQCKVAVKGMNMVSHQAALGSVPRSIENPLPTNEINAQGFIHMITASKDEGIKRFVYASSSSVYGDSLKSPKVEHELGYPLSPYAVSKLTNEQYGRVFTKLYGIQTVGLRYFNVFGINQDPNGAYAAAIPKFINLFRTGQSPIIYGDGEQTRDFTHITNVIHANERALFADNAEAFGESFNVACGDSYSLNYVISVIKNALIAAGENVAHIEPIHQDERKGDIRNSLADTTKISNLLGYQVQTNFEDGMQTYINQIIGVKA